MDRSLRDAVVERDGFRCQACGRRTRGQVHHLLARSQGGSDSLRNLVTLCGRCHMLVSPIPVPQLMAYFGVSEDELLVRKARVEVAVNSWVLQAEAEPACLPECARSEVGRLPEDRRGVTFAQLPKPSQEGLGAAAGALRVSGKAYSLKQVRRQHPRAYEPWTGEEDQRLRAGCEQGLDVAELARAFQRKQSAIRSRLKRLGCRPDYCQRNGSSLPSRCT